MDSYAQALSAASSATKAKRWTQPVKIFGYIVIVMAALAALGAIILVLTSGGRGSALSAGLIAVATAAVVFLQGSVVLMLAHYVQMRAEEVTLRVAQLLEGEDSAPDLA